jgi:7-cyano-7-deazaguanine synthase
VKTIVILSGGLDSTTLLYHYKAEGHQLHALTFNYGQRHDRELEAARTISEITQTPQEVVDLTALRPLFGANALTDHKVDLPSGEYAKETIGITTVPNRNMIMLSVAIGRAISLGFDAVAFGAHGGVNDVMYPDCSPEFAAAVNTIGQVCDNEPISVLAPFVCWEKSDIVRRGHDLGVPFEHTWSCYEGNDLPCGKCGTCIDRIRAFEAIGLRDWFSPAI